MPDMGFVGASYIAQSITQDDQETINWYPEKDSNKDAKKVTDDPQRGVIALYPTPGLALRKEFAGGGPLRGAHTLPGGTAFLAVAGSTLFRVNSAFTSIVAGNLATTTGPVSISDNGVSAMITDGPNRYTYTIASGAFTISSDGAFTGATMCDIVDNYLVYNFPGSQQWGCTNTLSEVSSALNVASKDGSSDNLVGLIVVNRQVFLMGELTYEVWTDAGLFPFPFQRIPGTSKQHGCAAPFSIARLGEGFAWLTNDTRGNSTIALMVGYQPLRISTHAVEYAIEHYSKIDDAIAYTYQQAGHEFYVLTFPTADVTWVYDLATQLWHKRAWRDPLNVLHRHRSNCMTSFNNEILVGDYQNGNLYAFSQSQYTDNGATIPCIRRCPHITTDLRRQYFHDFQIQFQPGVGLQGPADNYMNLPGAVGDYASTPDSVASSITGDIDIRAFILPSALVNSTIVAKVSGVNQYSYSLDMLSSGIMIMTVSPDGLNIIQYSATSALSLSSFPLWVRVAFTTGALYSATFYTSTNGSTWTQLGAVVSGGSGLIFDGTAPVEIGGGAATPFNLSGKIYRAQIYSGINGVLKVDFNANDASAGATVFASSSTGEVYTLHGTAAIVGNYSAAIQAAANPQAMLTWSDDGGFTWSKEHWASIGRAGKYRNRAIWRRLGTARDRIFQVEVSDPVFRAVISANLNASIGAT